MMGKFSNLLGNSLFFILVLGFCCFDYLNRQSVKAQVIEDGSLSTEVNTENSREFTINGGEQRGGNLFHSFSEFSIPTNGSVSFNNGLSIQNIISRVTGSSISNIDGLIQSNGTANLFLINPNGIIFGENARLNIGGSFVGTTAESLVFADDAEFSSNLDIPEPLLTVNVPTGLQFGSDPGEIVNQANFSIPNPFDPSGETRIPVGLGTAPGNTLALIGGDITFDGGAISTAGGNVELGSVDGGSFVAINAIANGWRANYNGVEQFRNIEFDNSAVVDASGEGGGRVNLRGQNIQILNGSSISSNTTGSSNGQDISITASDRIEIRGSDPTNQNIDPGFAALGIFFPASSVITSNTFGVGNGGDIKIQAQKLSIFEGAKIQAQTRNLFELPQQIQIGDGGSVVINAAEVVELDGFKSLLGIADNVGEDIINQLFPLIPPEAEEVVSVDRIIDISRGSSIDVVSSSNGASGDIDIVTNQLTIGQRSSISNSPSPFSSSDGGGINIEALDSVQILGFSEPGSQSVGIITANTFGTGNAGNITLATEKLLLENGGGITAGTLSSGNGGGIILDTTTIEIIGTSGDGVLRSGFGSEAFSTGNAGDVIVNTQDLTIANNGQITVRGLSSGTPGNLTINANLVRLNNAARITAENVAASDGGNIEFNIVERLTLGQNSLISAQAFNDANGGNIDILGGFVVANPNENNDILATAIRGNGGNINIRGEGIFGIQEGVSNSANSTNDIDASSEFGLDGMVSFNFPETTNSSFEPRKYSNIIKVSNLLNNSFCKISAGSKYYSIGKGGIAISPDRDLNIQDSWTDFRFFDGEVVATEKTRETEQTPSRTKIEPIQGWFRDNQGKLVLTAKSSVATPHSSALPYPDCNL